ncbi:MAG: hypothetical protein IPL61_30225 [Myxococcales bacterium]|nr:hypothetical protein [Myxococcales bacterium]
MKHLSTIVTAALAAASLAACGGKSKGADAPVGGTGGAAPESDLPFDPEAVRQQLATSAGNEACGVEGGETFGGILKRQGDALGTADETDISFECQPSGADDGTYGCTWSVFSKPPAAPDPDDPCGGECCSGYQIMITVNADGTFDPASANCVAPG